MSAFLDKVSGMQERTRLESWVRGSVGAMDRILDDGFPNVFGKNWRQKMSDFPTTARTKLLTYVFDHALEVMAPQMKVKYRAANNEGRSETNHFDCYIFDYEVENKLSLGRQASSFATGSSHNTENKVSRILVVKVLSEDYRTKKVFAAFVDLADAINKDSKWHTAGRSGFSTLKISVQDEGIIVPLCGKIRSGKRFVQTEHEPFEPERG